MVNSWHDCIKDELQYVEDLMMENLAYRENPELTEMCQYVISSGGKRLRPALCIMSYNLNGGMGKEGAFGWLENGNPVVSTADEGKAAA